MLLSIQSPLRRNSRPRGYTLVELVIAVGLVSIIASVAMPTLTQLHRDESLVASAEAVAGFVNASRRVAIAKKRCVNVRIDSGAGNLTSTWDSPGANVAGQALTAWEETIGDCETFYVIGPTTYPSSYWKRLPLGSLRATQDLSFTLLNYHTHVPLIWRPGGWSRGNSGRDAGGSAVGFDTDLANDGFDIKVLNQRTLRFVIVRFTSFGQSCTGRVGESNPNC